MGKEELLMQQRLVRFLFVDIIDNPATRGVTPQSYFKWYLIITDFYSRYTTLIGLHGKTTEDVIQALEEFCTYHRPHAHYNLKNDVDMIHPDAGSQLISSELVAWGKQPNIRVKIEAAAPHHQEQNGLVERYWQEVRKIAYSLLISARLGISFFDLAIAHAWKILNVLPGSSCVVVQDDGTNQQSMPFALFYGRLPRIFRFRHFGCPCIFKVYRKEEKDTGRHLNPSTLLQRGVRGIHVGFPLRSAGYLIFVASTGQLIVSADVAFDERHESTLSYGHTAFFGALPARSDSIYPDFTSLARTGVPPVVFLSDSENEALGPWCPHTVYGPSTEVHSIKFPLELTDPILLARSEEGEADRSVTEKRNSPVSN